MRVRVDACALRRGGQWLITYRVTPGAVTAAALSSVEVPVGKDCIVRDGKVVK